MQILSVKNKKYAKKKVKKQPKPTFRYEIVPTNFFTLPPDKQNLVLSKFLKVIASVQKRITVTMTKEIREVDFSGDVKQLLIPKTFISSEEPLDQILQNSNLQYKIVDEISRPKVKIEKLDHLVFEDGTVGKMYTLYQVPGSMSPAWIKQILDMTDEVTISFKPIANHIAIPKMTRYIGTLGALAKKSMEAGYIAKKGKEVLENLTSQETALIDVTVNVLIRAESKISLRDESKTFTVNAKGMMAKFDSVISKQIAMYKGWGSKMHWELGSCIVFYPFVSTDMVEVPNGVVLGKNLSTGAPVVYDYTLRDNYNILVLATSGAGKSVTAKTVASRILKKNPQSHIFIVDPNGEYENVAEYLDMSILKVTEEKELGLDPFKLFAPNDAAEILAEIMSVPTTVRTKFLATATNCKTIFEFYDKLKEDEEEVKEVKPSNFIQHMVTGRFKEMLEGESKLDDRTIISLKGTAGENSMFILLLLALGKMWKKINELPKNIPKILLIDEGWMLFKHASASNFLSMIARVGRKFNVIFVFITQRPEDVIENEAGKAFADNAGTKFFLLNSEQAAEKIQKSMNFSDQEKEMISEFDKGQALLVTRDHRIKLQVMPSVEELKIFSTTPFEDM